MERLTESASEVRARERQEAKVRAWWIGRERQKERERAWRGF